MRGRNIFYDFLLRNSEHWMEQKKREVVARLMLCSLVSRYVELVGCICAGLFVVVDSV